MNKFVIAILSFFTMFIAIFAAYTYLDGSYNKTNAHNAHIDVSEFVKSADYSFQGLADVNGGAQSLFESVNNVVKDTQFLDSDWGVGGIKQLINQPSDAKNPFDIVNRAAKIVIGLVGNILLAPLTLILSVIAVVWWICIYIGQIALLVFNLLSGGFIIFV